MLAGVLERCMKRRGVRDCDPYDWEKLAEAPQSVTTSSSSAAVPSKPQQRIITNPGTANVTTDNLGEDPLAASIGLNNQENMHPGDMAVAASAAVPPVVDRRTPLQTAQVVSTDKEGGTNGDGSKSPVPVNGQSAQVNAQGGYGYDGQQAYAGYGVGGQIPAQPEEDEFELIEHNTPVDIEKLNRELFERNQDL